MPGCLKFILAHAWRGGGLQHYFPGRRLGKCWLAGADRVPSGFLKPLVQAASPLTTAEGELSGVGTGRVARGGWPGQLLEGPQAQPYGNAQTHQLRNAVGRVNGWETTWWEAPQSKGQALLDFGWRGQRGVGGGWGAE